jgi:hypothetical protein
VIVPDATFAALRDEADAAALIWRNEFFLSVLEYCSL